MQVSEDSASRLLVDLDKRRQDGDDVLRNIVAKRHRVGLQGRYPCQPVVSTRGMHGARDTHDGDRLGELPAGVPDADQARRDFLWGRQ